MSSIAKIIEVIGVSDKSWEAAAQLAVDEAKKSVHGIHGVKVMDMTADVDSNGKLTRFKTTVKMSFGVERS